MLRAPGRPSVARRPPSAAGHFERANQENITHVESRRRVESGVYWTNNKRPQCARDPELSRLDKG